MWRKNEEDLEASCSSETYELFFSLPILHKTIERTNKKGKKQKTGQWVNTDVKEIKAMISMLLIMGTTKDGMVRTNSLR